jgi:2-keto-4-pentenoate hydratase/2-oxohepta-3-ene-1,7-dioic acid hydratase in catechol pathway
MRLKLITFQCLRSGGIRPGICLPDLGVIDLLRMNHPLLPESSNMLSLISNYEDLESDIKKFYQNPSKNSILTSKQYKLLAPIPFPRRNLFCVGKNYMDHVQETSQSSEPVSKPKYPQFFTKVPETVIGPNELIPSHSSTTRWLDYEAEVAVIIGKQGCDISPEMAMNHVFGYTIANDISARDVQKRHVQFMKGKCLDRTCPLGPAIVVKEGAEEGPLDAQNLKIQLWVNNELRQDSSTSQMIFQIPEIISQLSKGMTLYPGDIILTGTPAGVGFAMTPPQVLKPNDLIKIEIEGLGVLENRVGP